jgi:predicted RNase H-like nuclease
VTTRNRGGHDEAVHIDRWRDQLQALVVQGLTDHGPDDVTAALATVLARAAATDAVPTPISVPAPVLGVDACSSGWVGVLLTPDVRPSVLVGGTVASLVSLARESADLVVVAIDIPIGLPDGDGREEVDEWVRSGPGVIVIEVHPEVSFARMAGDPLLSQKSDATGVSERRGVLERAGILAPAWFRGSDFREDDLLDACAAAWTAVRHARGESESLPSVPEVFNHGTPAAIWV